VPHRQAGAHAHGRLEGLDAPCHTHLLVRSVLNQRICPGCCEPVWSHRVGRRPCSNGRLQLLSQQPKAAALARKAGKQAHSKVVGASGYGGHTTCRDADHALALHGWHVVDRLEVCILQKCHRVTAMYVSGQDCRILELLALSPPTSMVPHYW
jgi:hypothetical protein